MGAKAEIFYEAKQIRTNTPVMCIICLNQRILNYNKDYEQWICDKCSGEIPTNTRTIKYKRYKKTLLQRKYRLRSVPRWISSLDKNTE
jgi:hypothetical protein